MKVEFNSQQIEAIEAAVRWYKGWCDGRHRKQYFFLAGYAGTGKTTVAREIADRCAETHRVRFIAPTGKAASRLRQKGCIGAITLHQFAYNVVGEDDEGEPIFVEKGALENIPKLIVMDESSMVGQRDANTLFRHGIPVLALGDLGQVPPVRSEAFFTRDSCDFELTEIMRQNATSNIIRASFFVREGGRLPPREYDDVKVFARRPEYLDIRNHCGEDSVILCSYNNTRNRINQKARQYLGRRGMPYAGDKIVCTSNQHSYGVMNGEQFILIGYEAIPDEKRDNNDINQNMMLATGKCLATGREIQFKFNLDCFGDNSELREESFKKDGGFDWGWALTIHKSQGSEWENVMWIEENLRNIPYANMAYTAITRAVKHLTVFRDPSW